MTWYVYIIRCNNGALYTGVTTDVTRRFNEHNAQGAKTAKFLRGKTPLTLIGSLNASSRSNAQKIESKIKKLSKQKKEALCKSECLSVNNYLIHQQCSKINDQKSMIKNK